MRNMLLFVAILFVLAALFTSNAEEEVQWGVLNAVAAISLALLLKDRFGKRELRERERAWKTRLADCASYEQSQVKAALRRGVAVEPELAPLVVEGARLKLEKGSTGWGQRRSTRISEPLPPDSHSATELGCL